jgi:photosystem II stability/assembly factor-like uncharacterized protein
MRYILFSIILLASCTAPSTIKTILLTDQTSGSNASLRGLDVVDENIAWASGAEGTVLRTLDGGTTWEDVSISSADTIDFRDIEAFSATEAVILSAGFPGVVLKTTDGGKSWDLVYEDLREDIFFDAMDFWDDKNGIAFGDAIDGRIVIIKTKDGGNTWQLTPDEDSPEALDGEGGFAASGTCITTLGDSHVWIAMGAPKSRVLYSSDKGETWTATETPMAQDAPGAGIFSLEFSDPKNGIAVGGNYMAPKVKKQVLAKSSDGGKSWLVINDSGLNGYKSAVAQVPNSKTWVASGPSGVSYSITDGNTWSLLDSAEFHTIVMASDKVGYLTGGNGKISRLEIKY